MIRKIFLFLFFTPFLYSHPTRVIRLDSHYHLGMFASANQVLGQLYLFETGQLKDISGILVDFGEHGLYYDSSQGPNWWTYYFEPIHLGKKETDEFITSTKEEYVQAWEQRRRIPRSTAAELVNKYIHIKPHIQEKIDAFVHEHFLNSYTIGIHYRGTDKVKEAPRIDYNIVFKELEKQLPSNQKYTIFIATDEADFLEEAQKRYPDRIVASQAHRSRSDSGVHFMHPNHYSLGEEALIDAYLLSQCDLLIRTSSSLSLWSTYFNPNLPVILLNQRYITTLEPE